MKKKAKFSREGVILGGLGAIFLTVMVFGWVQTNQTGPEPIIADNNPQAYSLTTMEIAGKFDCSCGACQEDTAADCQCPTAKATRNFIEKKIRSGMDENEIIDQVQSTFGNYRG
ncbi:MAG: hypothetical protein GXO90_06660 [FCB group bacterium]|nr:hypothetical protein [FCB group bacterium]